MDIQIDLLYAESEIDLLLDGLLAGDFAEACRPHYASWRSRTREELWSGRQVAVGAWTIPDEYSGEREELAGACILRKTDSLQGPELTMEVLYVARKYRNPHYYPNSLRANWIGPPRQIGTELLSKAEQLCEKYGYGRITTEAHVHLTDLIFFLLRQRFIVHGCDVEKGQYFLAKHLKDVYNADPYDVEMIVEWLCQKWGMTIENWVGPDHVIAAHTLGEHIDWNLEAHLLICKNSDDLRRKMKELDGASKLVLFETEEDELPGAINEKVHCLFPTDLRRETGSNDLNLALRDTVCAVVVSIRRDLFHQFEADEAQVFLDGVEYGRVPLKRVENEPDWHAFVVFSDSDVNHQEILGVGIIQEVAFGSPNGLWKDFGRMSTFEDRSAFNQYGNIKTRMTAIVFDHLEINRERIDFSDKLAGRGWCYLTEDEFFKCVLGTGGYPKTERLVSRNR